LNAGLHTKAGVSPHEPHLSIHFALDILNMMSGDLFAQADLEP
jgi:hypothetical protein